MYSVWNYLNILKGINWRPAAREISISIIIITIKRAYLGDLPSVGEENGAFFIRAWKPLSNTHFKNLEGKPKRESPKRIISSSGGLGRLQIVSEPRH